MASSVIFMQFCKNSGIVDHYSLTYTDGSQWCYCVVDEPDYYPYKMYFAEIIV